MARRMYRRVSDISFLPNSYDHVDQEGAGGYTPMMHELDDYIEEKGVPFDMGMLRTRGPVGKTIPTSDARIWLEITNPKLIGEVVVPGIVHIAFNYGCRVHELRKDQEVGGHVVLEVRH